jgi:hypothetical protein
MKYGKRFSVFVILIISLVSSCDRSSRDLFVTPPASNPLTRNYVGYGVVTVSFTHLLSEPAPTSSSEGHLRRGTVLRVIERRQVTNQGNSQSWVLAETDYLPPAAISRGWLLETNVQIFDRQSRALTASRAMGQ